MSKKEKLSESMISLPFETPLEFSKSELEFDNDNFLKLLTSSININDISFHNVSHVNDELNQCLRSNKMLSNIYNSLLIRVAKLVGADCAQLWGTIRINIKGSRSVPFHIDQWSGHPRNIVNVWVPLTSLDETNTLHFVDQPKSEALIKSLRNNSISLSEFDRECFNNSFSFINKDNIVLFSNQFLHGTYRNNSETRISLDFRLAFSDDFSGKKIIGQDYKFIDDIIEERIISKINPSFSPTSVNVLLLQENKFSNVSHNAQRQLCRLFCKTVNFTINEEGSDFQGFDNFPQLEMWLTRKNDNLRPVVIPSVKCVSNEFGILDGFLKLVALGTTKIYFALEGVEARRFING